MMNVSRLFDPYAGYFRWYISTPSPPPPPDPVATADAQGHANVNTAIAQNALNNVDQITPYGNINYTASNDPNSGTWVPGIGSGGAGEAFKDPAGTPAGDAERAHPGQMFIPRETATTSLSPGMQTLFNQNLANSQQASDTAGALGKNVNAVLSKNVDLGPSATSAYLDNLNRKTLDPQWAQAQTELNQQLANQGLTPGSAGWDYQQTQFGLNKDNAYNSMYLQGQNTAAQDILAQYNEPLNALSALKSNSQVSQPGIGTLAPSAQSQIQPPNYQGIVENNANLAMQQYQAQSQASNAVLGGLFGLGGNLIGGLGKFSDRKDKTDIEKLGKDPRTGVDMYAYRYKNDPKRYPKSVGPMAQDVEKKFPGRTRKIGGHRVVDLSLEDTIRAAVGKHGG